MSKSRHCEGEAFNNSPFTSKKTSIERHHSNDSTDPSSSTENVNSTPATMSEQQKERFKSDCVYNQETPEAAKKDAKRKKISNKKSEERQAQATEENHKKIPVLWYHKDNGCTTIFFRPMLSTIRLSHQKTSIERHHSNDSTDPSSSTELNAVTNSTHIRTNIKLLSFEICLPTVNVTQDNYASTVIQRRAGCGTIDLAFELFAEDVGLASEDQLRSQNSTNYPHREQHLVAVLEKSIAEPLSRARGGARRQALLPDHMSGEEVPSARQQFEGGDRADAFQGARIPDGRARPARHVLQSESSLGLRKTIRSSRPSTGGSSRSSSARSSTASTRSSGICWRRCHLSRTEDTPWSPRISVASPHLHAAYQRINDIVQLSSTSHSIITDATTVAELGGVFPLTSSITNKVRLTIDELPALHCEIDDQLCGSKKRKYPTTLEDDFLQPKNFESFMSNPTFSNLVSSSPPTTSTGTALAMERRLRKFLTVPAFSAWTHNPKLGFELLEEEFLALNITSDGTKHNALINNLGNAATSSAVSMHVQAHTGPDRYNKLKEFLIQKYTDTTQQQIKKLFSQCTLGDKKPSEFYAELLNNAKDHAPPKTVLLLWAEALPQSIALYIDDEVAAGDVEKAVAKADRIQDRLKVEGAQIFDIKANHCEGPLAEIASSIAALSVKIRQS
ncbi:unnamed protein product [Trichogramma brassicae]|uniref:DUF7041 domain-containing protein n=1 Tax=Trichogramma brassicae TaxID=86971 RepID=A0A6H5IPI4_9HYME|nr:unnamed protein product [Trichogramma brassicae]